MDSSCQANVKETLIGVACISRLYIVVSFHPLLARMVLLVNRSHMNCIYRLNELLIILKEKEENQTVTDERELQKEKIARFVKEVTRITKLPREMGEIANF